MRQKGFTLLEQLVVLSITGVIVLVVAASYILIRKGRTDIVQTDVALTDIDGAVHWLSRDLVLAQTTSLTDGGSSRIQREYDLERPHPLGGRRRHC